MFRERQQVSLRDRERIFSCGISAGVHKRLLGDATCICSDYLLRWYLPTVMRPIVMLPTVMLPTVIRNKLRAIELVFDTSKMFEIQN